MSDKDRYISAASLIAAHAMLKSSNEDLADADGGVFVPRYVQEQLSEYEMKMLQMPWETPKYNLNKRVLIL